MIPYLLAALGGYLVGDSVSKQPKKFGYGGTIEYGIRVWGKDPETGERYSWVYDIEADSQDEALDKAKKKFKDEYEVDAKFEYAEILREEEFA